MLRAETPRKSPRRPPTLDTKSTGPNSSLRLWLVTVGDDRNTFTRARSEGEAAASSSSSSSSSSCLVLRRAAGSRSAEVASWW